MPLPALFMQHIALCTPCIALCNCDHHLHMRWRMVHMSWMIWMTWVIWMIIQMKTSLTWMNGFPKMGEIIEIESSSLSLYV
jgi:hypothetical protein